MKAYDLAAMHAHVNFCMHDVCRLIGGCVVTKSSPSTEVCNRGNTCRPTSEGILSLPILYTEDIVRLYTKISLTRNGICRSC
jgi:hypothetical protein